MYAYGDWLSVIVSTVLFSAFTIGYMRPIGKMNWRSLGLLEAFFVALFTEMYGFPLTIYILSAFLGLPLTFGHIEGHLLATTLSMTRLMSLEIAWALVMIVSSLLVLIGVGLLYKGWVRIHKSESLIIDEIYALVRHPQYLGIILIITGLIIQWPTIATLVMYPVLVFSYYRLAKREESDMAKRFGEKYIEYARATPMLLPRIRRSRP